MNIAMKNGAGEGVISMKRDRRLFLSVAVRLYFGLYWET